jgi:hypothetical protein
MESLVSLAKMKHGHANGDSPTYRSWLAAIQRCTNPNSTGYKFYGGATPPVKMCRRWRESFQAFLGDLGERLPNTSLGRILDTGNYEQGNAFWMTKKEQALAQKNKRALLKWAQGGAA